MQLKIYVQIVEMFNEKYYISYIIYHRVNITNFNYNYVIRKKHGLKIKLSSNFLFSKHISQI